jgi:hypothetical protein
MLGIVEFHEEATLALGYWELPLIHNLTNPKINPHERAAEVASFVPFPSLAWKGP